MDIRISPITSAPEEMSIFVTEDKDIALRTPALATLAEQHSTMENRLGDIDHPAPISPFRPSGAVILTDPSGHLAFGGGAPHFRIPGGISHASCWMALAAALNIRLHIRDVSLHRSGLIFTDLLVRMGVRIREEVKSLGPIPVGDLDIRGSRLQGITIPASYTPFVSDDIAILAVLSVFARGNTTILGLKNEQRFLGTLCTNLRLMGVPVEKHVDGLGISGCQTLRGADLPSDGDPRLAKAFTIAGLLAQGESVIRDMDTEACPELFESIWQAHIVKMN